MIKGKIDYAKVIETIIIVILSYLLFMNFWKNSFGFVEESWFELHQVDSEWTVLDRIYDDVNHGFSYNAGLLGACKYEPPYVYDDQHPVYTAQIGLQAFVDGILVKFLGVSIDTLHALVCILFLVCVIMLAYLIGLDDWRYQQTCESNALIPSV